MYITVVVKFFRERSTDNIVYFAIKIHATIVDSAGYWDLLGWGLLN